MIDLPELIKDKKAVFLGLDDVLYPEKDYLLQVYYLFAEFLAYTEQLDAAKIISFMQAYYEKNGSINIFAKTAEAFYIPLKYEHNFSLLHQTARLPLKLLLYQNVLLFLQELVRTNKEIFLLVDGDPAQQLNKIKQFEWNGLEKYLKLYFIEEFEPKPSFASVNFIMEQHHLKLSDLLLVGNSKLDEDFALQHSLAYIPISELL